MHGVHDSHCAQRKGELLLVDSDCEICEKLYRLWQEPGKCSLLALRKLQPCSTLIITQTTD